MRRLLDRTGRQKIATTRKEMIATAADIRKAIQRSLKSGGKDRYSKSYQTSRPWEPPRTHGKRLKQSIRYEIRGDKIIVGAGSIAGGRTAKILEEGGEGTIKETTTRPGYFEERKRRAQQQSRARRAAIKSGAVPEERPKTKRGYTMRSESGQTRRVTKYERFTSEASARRAMNSPGFKTWREKVQKTTTVKVRIEPRPYVTPAALSTLRKKR